ncbi:hypothetical protein JCM8115_002887 [Rhodotorula mucilaginosa]|uniref:Uncharacterized protein n=1 Tax=Rhodotorula mucilaginosa TaxID=5537 RepID=A0A9P7B5F0_RHOMI|nr:hypothetical protein C6P46_005336 [Rhodotorula mucilaginosa]TKA51702.1 hypothetical protein B0A53_05407 [Rhodotorula sp. CCFEE 5036]
MAPDASEPTVAPTTPSPSNIVLWVHPRSTSTMFECMLLARSDFQVHHEPMGEAWYYGDERASTRFTDEQRKASGNADATYAQSWREVAKPHPTLRTFSKDMAQYLMDLNKPKGTVAPSFGDDAPTTRNNPTRIPTAELLQPHINHTFLIRHPQKAVPSYARLCYPGAPTGFDYFDPAEMGYKELRLLFDFIREETGRTPLLIESEELLAMPVKVVRGWCEHVGIEFTEGMLEWDDAPETRTHFEKWTGFHDDAAASKGVGRQSPAQDAAAPSQKGKQEPKPLSPELQQAVDGCMEDYEYLRSFAHHDW